MTTRAQENFPLPRLDMFSHATQDDYEHAKDKARQLLRQILPDNSWAELEEKGIIQVAGKRGHIFNLGHGVPPNAKLENIQALVDTVREAK